MSMPCVIRTEKDYNTAFVLSPIIKILAFMYKEVAQQFSHRNKKLCN